MHDDDDATGFGERAAVVAAPAAARVEHGVAARERRQQRGGLEGLPRGLVDFAAAGDRAAEVERVAHCELLVGAAAERMLAHPVELAAAEQRECGGEAEAGGCAAGAWLH